MDPMTADPRTAIILARQHQAQIRATYPRPLRHPSRGLLGRLRATGAHRRAHSIPACEPVLQPR